MSHESLLFLLMLGAFAAGSFALRLPVSLSMMLASVAAMLASGNGLGVRHLVEGTFGYVDTMLVIATAMVFMRAVQESGALDAITGIVIRRFGRRPAALLPMLMLVAMFPGMITGSSSASVLTAGAVVAPALMLLGLPRETAGAFIAIAGILGMVAPPVNIPAMIIGGGIDMPFVGFGAPLALLTFPLAIAFSWALGAGKARPVDPAAAGTGPGEELYRRYGPRLFLPVLLVVALMVLGKAAPSAFGLGLPVTFLIGAAAACLVGRRFNALSAAKAAIGDALPVLGILAGVGMFIQTMTLTGVRGFVVVGALSVPPALLFAAIALTMPLFGAVSSFGAASVLGVPFLLALLGRDQVIAASALSLVAALGDFMPPTALSAMFAAQVVGVERYSLVLRKLLVPSLVVVLWALAFIGFSTSIRGFL